MSTLSRMESIVKRLADVGTLEIQHFHKDEKAALNQLIEKGFVSYSVSSLKVAGEYTLTDAGKAEVERMAAAVEKYDSELRATASAATEWANTVDDTNSRLKKALKEACMYGGEGRYEKEADLIVKWVVEGGDSIHYSPDYREQHYGKGQGQ